MKGATLRLATLLLLAAAVAAVVWLAARREPPAQPISLSVAVDRGTEAMETADRVGELLTRLPDAEEIELGRALAARVTPPTRVPSSPEAERRRAYVAGVVTRLVAAGGLRRPGIPYTAEVLEVGDANAYALPGGRVFLTAPLLGLLDDEAEVAGVMGHEIAHVDLRHCVERIQYRVQARKVVGAPFDLMVAAGAHLWRLGYADELELEADRQGMLYAARAGYHPEGLARALERLARAYGEHPRGSDRLGGEVRDLLAGALDEYFATHPPTAERLSALGRAARELHLDPAGKRWYVGRENRRTLVARSLRELPGEWVSGHLPELSPAASRRRVRSAGPTRSP